MGVPRLFSYMKRTYSQSINIDKSTIQLDSIYLDANALLYPIAEEDKIAEDIARKLLIVSESYGESYGCICHIYIDGSAHMGKIRQQRLRRYTYEPVSMIFTDDTSIGDKTGTVSIASSPIEWSSAVFTPGTIIMEQIHLYILDHIHEYPRIGTYSSYHEPGEGEHKIIRDIKNLSGSIGIVGKDADLLLLGMSITQEEGYNLKPYILRHNDLIVWDGYPNGYTPNDPMFHIDCTSLRLQIINQFNLSSIWDFIIATFLIGNDFLPSVPEMVNIYDALPIIQALSPKLYVNGSIDWNSFNQYIRDISAVYSTNRSVRDSAYSSWITLPDRSLTLEDFSLIYKFNVSSFPINMEGLIKSWKMTIQWIFLYYHDGLDTASRAWQYPFHYSPSLSDLNSNYTDSTGINDIVSLQVNPLTPIQALSSVLPPWLHNLIPDNRLDPIIDRYPQYYPYAFSYMRIRDSSNPTRSERIPILVNIPYEIAILI